MSEAITSRARTGPRGIPTTPYLFPAERHPRVGELLQWPGRPANEVAISVSPGPVIGADMAEEHGAHLEASEGEAGVWVSVRPATALEQADRHSVFLVAP